MGERKRGLKAIVVATVVSLIIGAGVGSVVGVRVGEQRGEERVKAELGERVGGLGEIVLEKSRVSEAGRATFMFLGEEISGEAGIEQIIAGLKEVQEVAKLETAREAVENLLSRTEEFREVYRDGDSVAISHEYESLKDAFRAGAEKLNEAYNSKIKELSSI